MFEWLKKPFSKPTTIAPAPSLENEKETKLPTKPCQSCGKPISYDPTWKHISNFCEDCKANHREEILQTE